MGQRQAAQHKLGQSTTPEHSVSGARAGSSSPAMCAALGVLAFASVSFVVALNLTPIYNNDFWIQLKIGDLIRETGQLPETVLFSFAEIRDAPFVAYEWLSSLIWSAFFPLGGYEGMIVLKCALLLCIFTLSVLLAFQVSGSLMLSLALGSLSCLAINYRSQMRPELLGFLFALISFNLLQAFARTGNPRWLLGLLPISILWANAHGSFLLNLALPGYFAVAQVLDGWWLSKRRGRSMDLPRIRQRCGWLIAVSMATACLSLVNPYGFGLITHVLQLSGSDYIRENIIEWVPISDPIFRDDRFFLIFAGLSCFVAVSLVACWKRAKPSLLLLTLVFWLLSLDAMRHAAWFGIISCFVLAHLLREPSRSNRLRVGTTLALGAVLLAATFTVAKREQLQPGQLHLGVGPYALTTRENVRGRHAGFNNVSPLTEGAIEFIRSAGLSGAVFNKYPYGDQLVYHFYPSLKVAIDSRVDAYGEQYYRNYRALSGRSATLLAEPSALIGFLRKYEVNVIVTHPFDLQNWIAGGHADALDADGWAPVYRDARTFILLRKANDS